MLYLFQPHKLKVQSYYGYVNTLTEYLLNYWQQITDNQVNTTLPLLSYSTHFLSIWKYLFTKKVLTIQ